MDFDGLDQVQLKTVSVSGDREILHFPFQLSRIQIGGIYEFRIEAQKDGLSHWQTWTHGSPNPLLFDLCRATAALCRRIIALPKSPENPMNLPN